MSLPTANLRVGDWVEVRSAEEILATLDATARLEGLPFMPEMLQYCGRRFKVFKSAHKTCDTIAHYTIRHMADAVHLEELRCDGGGHDGCQAGCLLFWKTAWLKPVDGSKPEVQQGPAPNSSALEPVYRATRVPSGTQDAAVRYSCQATEVLNATTEVRRRDRWDPRFYLKDLTSGNVTLGKFVWWGLVAAFNAFSIRWFGRRYPHLCGTAGTKSKPPKTELGLQSGDLVQVRSKQQIMQTLNSNLRNRGLYFDYEMVPYCEKTTYAVLRRVERIVDEKTGYMLNLANPCIILDGVTCSGTLSKDRMFCPRAIFPYWREEWLKSVTRHNGSESRS